MASLLPGRQVGSVDKIAPRYVFEARVQIRLKRDNRNLNLQGWVRDLSESGLRAFVAESLVPGESVIFEIPLPGYEKLMIPAEVVRALGTEYGFQFTALSADQRSQIRGTLQGRSAIVRAQP